MSNVSQGVSSSCGENVLCFAGGVGVAGAGGSEDSAAPAVLGSGSARRLPREETIRFQCGFCDRKLRVTVEHYDRFECVCGRIFWALRPKRFGPLVAFPWPGTPEMLRYKQEQGKGSKAKDGDAVESVPTREERRVA